MMKLYILALSTLAVIGNGLPINDTLPTVQDCVPPNGFDKCMNLVMPNGTKREVRMKYDDGNANILIGKVVGDEDSHVSVTIDDGEMEVMVSDKYGFITFRYNPTTGVSSSDTANCDHDNEDTDVLPDEQEDIDRDLTKVSARESDDKPLPSSFGMNIHVVTDPTFRKQFGKEMEQRILKIFAHVRTFFSARGLGTKINPTIVKMTAVDDIYPPEKLRSFMLFVKNNTDKISKSTDAIVLLHHTNKTCGSVSKAHRGKSCEVIWGRVSISSYFNNSNIQTARTIVQGIARNFDIGYDRVRGWTYVDKDGEECQRGFMSYDRNASFWSQCSEQAFKKYYNWYPRFCLGQRTENCYDKRWDCSRYGSACKSNNTAGKGIQASCPFTCYLC